MISTTLLLVGLVAVSAYLYSKYRHSFWSSRGIQTPPSIAFLGHLHKFSTGDQWKWMNEVYRKHCKSGYCGIYEGLSPILVVADLDLIKQIMVKDFDHFSSLRAFEFFHENDRTMNDMLLSVNGEAWKILRSILTPAFTSGKLRGMFDLVCEKVDVLVNCCLQETSKNHSVDIKDYSSRFVLDAIASCAFGFESNSITDKDSIFPKRAALFFDMDTFSSQIKFMLTLCVPGLMKALNISLLPPEVLFFNEITMKAIEARKNGSKRGDFLDLLLEAQSTHNSSEKSTKLVLDDDKLIAQCVLFIIAGYDTTASAMAFTSFLLAKYPEEQERLRNELRDIISEHQGITYQGIMQATFLEACIQEALRLYSPATITERLCTKPYQIPGANFTLQPGTLVQIPIMGIHMDDRYWPEPEIFKPDRFMPENKENIVHYSHLPFGIGPRNCIGMRFALMETKIALAKMVLGCNLDLAPGHEELKLTSPGGLLKCEGGVPVRLTPLSEE